MQARRKLENHTQCMRVDSKTDRHMESKAGFGDWRGRQTEKNTANGQTGRRVDSQMGGKAGFWTSRVGGLEGRQKK